jgi:excisionase family DNA binding protein
MSHSAFYIDEDMPLLTKKEFARAVGLALITIRKKRTQGLIPHFRFGRAVRFSRGQLEEFLT